MGRLPWCVRRDASYSVPHTFSQLDHVRRDSFEFDIDLILKVSLKEGLPGIRDLDPIFRIGKITVCWPDVAIPLQFLKSAICQSSLLRPEYPA